MNVVLKLIERAKNGTLLLSVGESPSVEGFIFPHSGSRWSVAPARRSFLWFTEPILNLFIWGVRKAATGILGDLS